MYTLEKFNKNTRELLSLLRTHNYLFNSFESVYIFGSSLEANSIPNDIDILLIYSVYSETVIDQLREIDSTLRTNYGLPLHLTVLSIGEEKETKFLERLKSKYIILK